MSCLTFSYGGDLYGALFHFINSRSVGLSALDFFGDRGSIASLWLLVLFDATAYFFSKDECDYVNYLFGFSLLANAVSASYVAFWTNREVFDDAWKKIYFIAAITLCPFFLAHQFAGHYGYSVFLVVILFSYQYNLHRYQSPKLIFGSSCLLYLLSVYNPYYFVIATIFLILIPLVYRTRKLLSSNAIIILIALLLVVILSYENITSATSIGSSKLLGRGESSVWGLMPWQYILPPTFVWDYDWYRDLFRNSMIIGNVPENTSYLSITGIVLLVIAIFNIRKDRSLAPLVLLVGISIALSLPPRIPFGSVTLYSPTYLIYELTGFFRIYNRFAIVTYLIAVLIAIRLMASSLFLRKFKKIIVVVLLIDLFPYAPPLKNVGKEVAEFEWLEYLGTDKIIYLPLGLKNKELNDDFQIYKHKYILKKHNKVLVRPEGSISDLELFCSFISEHRDAKIVLDRDLQREGVVPEDYIQLLPKLRFSPDYLRFEPKDCEEKFT